jgi:hypothetical protein
MGGDPPTPLKTSGNPARRKNIERTTLASPGIVPPLTVVLFLLEPGTTLSMKGATSLTVVLTATASVTNVAKESMVLEASAISLPSTYQSAIEPCGNQDRIPRLGRQQTNKQNLQTRHMYTNKQAVAG